MAMPGARPRLRVGVRCTPAIDVQIEELKQKSKGSERLQPSSTNNANEIPARWRWRLRENRNKAALERAVRSRTARISQRLRASQILSTASLRQSAWSRGSRQI